MSTTKTVVLCAVALFSSVAANSLTLYENAGFQGKAYSMYGDPYLCENVGSDFNDRASSATWSVENRDRSPTGAYVEFYEHKDCKGRMWSWYADNNNYPNNFAVDGINDMISSICVTGGDRWRSYDESAAVPRNATASSGN